jgi:LssY C-terminus
MVTLLLHTLWRVLIFGIGGVAIWFLVFEVVPYADKRLPTFFAVLLGYCILAYLIIPALFRLYHVIVKHDHIPLYVTTGDGWASDPVNLAIIVKDRKHLEKAFAKAGWYKADEGTLMNTLREGASILLNMPYPNAPVSTLYLFNRKHDIAFEIPTNDKLSARTRHHLRLWRLEAPLEDKHDHNHFDFWSSKLFKWISGEREVWVAACTEDVRPIGVRWRTGTITHAIDHNADIERDYTIQTLKNAHLVKAIDSSEPGESYKFRGQQFGTFITDGAIKVVDLK